MAGKGFEITGVEDVQRLLDDIAPKHAKNLLRSSVHGLAGQIAKESKKQAPKDDGTLQKAIKTKRRRVKNGKPRSDVVVTHGNGARHDAWYWRFVHYGTSGGPRLPENPFFRRAAANMQTKIPMIFTEQFGKKLEQKLKREAKKRNQ